MAIFDLIVSNSTIFLSLLFLLGLMVGSFLNVVIYRFPIMLQQQWNSECCEFLSEQDKSFKPLCKKLLDSQHPCSLSSPGSQCPHCQHKIRFYENIPVVSWLFLKGRCSNCQQKISIRYPLIELLTAFLTLAVGLKFGATLQTMVLISLVWSLIALSMIDYDTQLLPDDITLPVLWLGLLVSFFDFSIVDSFDALLGAMAGYLSLWFVFQLFKLITGKEGMGYGDFKLFALFGAWLGWQSLPVILFISTLSGAIIGLSLQLLLKKDKSIPIPFGPYLSIAGLIALFWGGEITNLYFNLAGLN